MKAGERSSLRKEEGLVEVGVIIVARGERAVKARWEAGLLGEGGGVSGRDF